MPVHSLWENLATSTRPRGDARLRRLLWRIRSSAERTVVAGFAVALVGLTLLGSAVYWSDARLRADAAAARRSELAIDAVHALAEAALEAESAVRAYALSGDGTFLAPFRAAVVTGPADLAEMQGRTPADARQQHRCDELARAFAEQLSILGEAVQASSEGRRADAAREVQQARPSGADVARLAREFEEAEDATQEVRDEVEARVSTATRWSVGLGMGSALLLVFVALSLVRTDFAGGRRARAALLASHKDLEERVRVRTSELAHLVDTLQASEERLRAVTDIARVGLVIVDQDHRYRYANRCYVEILKLPSADLVGKRVSDVLPAAYEEQIRPRLERAFRGERVNYELTLPGAPGAEGERRYAVSYEPSSHAGEPIVAVVILDVTERRQADVALRESEERFRQIAENIREVFWVTNASKTEMLYVSPAYAAIWGRSCESLYASPADWLEAIHPEDRKRVEAAARTRQTTDSYQETYRIVQPDGSIRWIHDRAFPVYDAGGAVARIVGLASDITKERTLEEQFRQAQKMEAVGRLAGGVAHDFNNILAVILSYAALLQEQFEPGDERAVDLEEIGKAGRRAAELTRQLLLFCRQEVMEPRRIDLNATVGSLRRMIERIVGEDIVIDTERLHATRSVQADPSHLDQILLNLVVNARDAMASGGTLTVETADVVLDESFRSPFLPTKPGPYVMVAVTDTGGGMDAATQARIFEPFFTTKERGKGTGLGLSTVFGVVQRGGGTLRVKSEPGRGARFELYLPRAEGHPDVEAMPSARRHGKRRGRILVVDDDRAVGTAASRSLARLGYEVVEAAGPLDALKLAAEAQQPFDLLLTDVVMPKLGGPALAERMETLQPGMKVLFMSGYAAAEGAASAILLEQGAAFLPKPFTPASLAHKVEAVLQA
ncbi:MAG TPA: PAS domain S-box protein [Polyangiaceae bacterium]|jgi:PAS domain S-box-containing protein